VTVHSFGCPQSQVCTNTTLAKVVASEINDFTDKYMILHSEEYFDLYMSPGVSTLLKRRRLRCAGNFSRVG